MAAAEHFIFRLVVSLDFCGLLALASVLRNRGMRPTGGALIQPRDSHIEESVT